MGIVDIPINILCIDIKRMCYDEVVDEMFEKLWSLLQQPVVTAGCEYMKYDTIIDF